MNPNHSDILPLDAFRYVVLVGYHCMQNNKLEAENMPG